MGTAGPAGGLGPEPVLLHRRRRAHRPHDADVGRTRCATHLLSAFVSAVFRAQGCGEIPYPNTIRDLIDFSLRECVRRDIRLGTVEAAGGTSPSPDGSRRSIAAVPARPESSAAAPPPSGSGRRAAGATRCFRNTAGNTSGVLPGSRQGNSQMCNLFKDTR